MKVAINFLAILIILMFFGCSSQKKPVLYPNSHLSYVGQYQADADINACMQAAEASGANRGQGQEVVQNAAKAGAVGGATGAVVGAISSSSDIGRGAAYGSAGSATAALVGGAFKASEPTSIYYRYVERCLRDKGYDPIGWR